MLYYSDYQASATVTESWENAGTPSRDLAIGRPAMEDLHYECFLQGWQYLLQPRVPEGHRACARACSTCGSAVFYKGHWKSFYEAADAQPSPLSVHTAAQTCKAEQLST